MSFIGKNIRKIRNIKKLTQSEFAEIFDIKRASIGAYEEGRAEPKIDTIASIAKYFSITLDKFITKELTVNDLYGFDIFKEGFPATDKNNLITSEHDKLVQIPFVKAMERKNANENSFSHEYLSKLPKLSLPNFNSEDLMALELASGDLPKDSLDKYFVEDILICQLCSDGNSPSTQQHDFIIIENRKLRFCLIENKETINLENSPILYAVVGAIRLNKIIHNPWINKIKDLEKRLRLIEEKLSKN